MELISNNDIIKKASMPSLTAKQGAKVKYMNQDYIVMPLYRPARDQPPNLYVVSDRFKKLCETHELKLIFNPVQVSI